MEAQDIYIARKALTSVPDIRDDKVNALKQQIQNNNYNVSNEAFADKMINKNKTM